MRIAGVDLNEKKKIPYSLCYIYGIGLSRAFFICKKLKINIDKKLIDLKDEELVDLRNFVENFKIENDLRAQVNSNIKDKISLRSYQGIRHQLKLPVRGQRTHSNAETSRRKRKSK